MITPTLSIQPIQPQAAGKAQADSAAPEKNFQQMLSREIGQRSDAQPQSPQAPANAAQAAEAATQGGAGLNGKAPGATATGLDKSASRPDKKTDDGATDAALPPELAAMVASLMQANPAAPGGAPAYGDSGSDIAAAAGKGNRAVAIQPPQADAEADTRTSPSVGKPAAGAAARARPESMPAALAEGGAASQSQAEAQAKIAVDMPAAAQTKTMREPAAQKLVFSEPAAVDNRQADFPAPLQPLAQSSQPAAPLMQAANARNGTLAPEVGAPGWDQALGQKIVWMVAGAEQSASLTLNPPDLGPLQVVLNVSHAQANAMFIAAQPEVRQALEAALPKLHEMLGQAGIQLGQASVSSGTPNRQGESGRQEYPAQRGAGGVQDAGMAAPLQSGKRVLSGGSGLVDTFV